MAIAFDGASIGNTGSMNQTTLTFAHTVGVGSDRLLLVGVATNSTASVTATYGGVALPLVGTQGGSTLFYLVNPPVGAANVVISSDLSNFGIAGGVSSWTGVHQTTPLGTFAGANGSSTAPFVNVSSTLDELVHDHLYISASSLPVTTAASDQTWRWQSSASTRRSAASTEPGAASVSMSWSLASSAYWDIAAVPIKPAPEVVSHPLTGGIVGTSATDLVMSVVSVQYARPTADVTAGTWTNQAGGASLFAAIGETVASDADYIQSANATTTADVSEVALRNLADPLSSTGHIVRYRYGKDVDSGDVVNLTVSLRQGSGTEIATWTHANVVLGSTMVAQTLTAAQADAITDYSALRLRFSATKV